MSDDESTDEPEEVEVATGPVADEPAASARERIEEEADRAVESFDEGVIDLLSWILDTNTRAQIYVYLRTQPWSSSEEVAEGTGLYPSTVREALAELHEEGTVSRRKRETEGAGNNPYEYTAIAPSELVGGVVQQIQDELNTVFNLDRYLGGPDTEPGTEVEPVSINVEEAEETDAEIDVGGGGDVGGGESEEIDADDGEEIDVDEGEELDLGDDGTEADDDGDDEAGASDDEDDEE